MNTKIEAISGQLNTKIVVVAGQLNSKIEVVGGQLNTKIEVIAGQLVLLANLAKLAIGLLGGLLATGLVTEIWWASGISSDVRHLETEVAEIRKAIDLPKKPMTGAVFKPQLN